MVPLEFIPSMLINGMVRPFYEMLVTVTRSMLYMSMPCYNLFFLLLFEGFGLNLYADLPSDAWQKFIGFQPCRTSLA